MTTDTLPEKSTKCISCGSERGSLKVNLCKNCGAELEPNNEQYIVSSSWKRYLSFGIDLLAISLVMNSLASFIELDQNEALNAAVFFGLYFAYFSLMPLKYSWTLGQRIMGLETLDIRTLSKPSSKSLLLREVLFLTVITGIGFIVYAIRGYYWDNVSNMIVVENNIKLASKQT